mmetsp:Transcript_24680/g.59398  ORF Transcript_24680/g.59398 Transcript_24680/m.59398 type:complete len:160 (-) Transcript_24680:58-537(-)
MNAKWGLSLLFLVLMAACLVSNYQDLAVSNSVHERKTTTIASQGLGGITNNIVDSVIELPPGEEVETPVVEISATGKQSSSKNNSAKKERAVALLYSGHVRSFANPAVRDSHLRGLINPFGSRASKFTYSLPKDRMIDNLVPEQHSTKATTALRKWKVG